MAEQMDLKDFYYSTLPTPENISRIKTPLESVIKSKSDFINLSNQTFAMLAHLKIDSSDSFNKLKDFKSGSSIFYICSDLKIVNNNIELNPTATPIIQRYMKIFEAYEQQNGIENPFAE